MPGTLHLPALLPGPPLGAPRLLLPARGCLCPPQAPQVPGRSSGLQHGKGQQRRARAAPWLFLFPRASGKFLVLPGGSPVVEAAFKDVSFLEYLISVLFISSETAEESLSRPGVFCPSGEERGILCEPRGARAVRRVREHLPSGRFACSIQIFAPLSWSPLRIAHLQLG